MVDLLLQGGRIIDPYTNRDEIGDILIKDGRIVDIDVNIDKKRVLSNTVEIIDVKDKIVTPGLIDMHIHLREPGQEDKETIATGTRAAAAGGFTAIACMPNTKPVIDNKSVVEFILRKSVREGVVKVYPIGSITKELKGKEIAEIGQMVGAGAVAISDDGYPVENAVLMRRAMEYTKRFNIPVISHCEDTNLSDQGSMHEGYYSTILGLPGIPAAAEEVMVARDIIIAEVCNAKLHIAHVSSKGSVELIRQAKKRGVKVTCEVTPHHFTLTDEAVCSFDTNTKVNPPLRSKDDVIAIKEGLADNTIDVIATDHAPHTQAKKEQEYVKAPFGIIGLETSLGLVLSELVTKGVISLMDAITKMTKNPAKILSLDMNGLYPGAIADITVIDPNMEWIVDVNTFVSKSRNSPFHGWKLIGRAIMTIVDGKIVWKISE
jgi:dihydroorotase